MPSKVDKANLPNLVLLGLIHNQVTSCLVILIHILAKCLQIMGSCKATEILVEI